MQDAADHTSIVYPILASYIRRQVGLDPLPLIVT
jgi:hypothetical protein